MMRPRRMGRVLVAGPAPQLKAVVEALHGARTLHLSDYTEQYPGFRLGRPMEGAQSRSEKLLRLRAASKVLGAESAPPPEKPRSAEWARMRIDGLVAALDSEVMARDREAQGLESSLRELEKRGEAVLPFKELPLNFEAYRPYESLAVFTGTVKSPIDGELSRLGGRAELFKGRPDGLLALFVEKSAEEEAGRLLARHEFSEVKPPVGAGAPAELLKRTEKEMAAARKRIAELRGELTKANEKYRDEIMACSEELSIEIQKAESPLHFAATPSCFVIEGWVPSDELDATENAILKASGKHVHFMRMGEQEWLEEGVCAAEKAAGRTGAGKDAAALGNGKPPGKGAGEPVTAAGTANGAGGRPDGAAEHRSGEGGLDPYECVPIALSNPRPVKPFEALTELFSLPNYREVDPTALLALVFPFFFGLMIGDLGYGALLVLTGILFRTKLRKWEGFPELGMYILAAGLFATFFGCFIFAEAFGVPFHAEAAGGAGAVSWSGILGWDIPLHAVIHKLESSGLSTLMVFSVLAGVVHLCLGNLLGAVNAWRRSRRHAAGKIGWLLIVLGFGLIILKFGEKNALGSWLWGGPLAPLASSWDPGLGILVPWSSVAFLASGVALAAAGEGPLALMELFSAISNILSYTRLAAIGVAKGAMAFAFNSILFPLVMGGNVGYAIFGWIFLVLAHMVVFVLGGLSAGIQALRLNFVEFFTKFHQGGGIKFNPFGSVRRYTVEKGE